MQIHRLKVATVVLMIGFAVTAQSCASLGSGGLGSGQYGTDAAYERSLTRKARSIRANLYSSIMLQTLASVTRAGHGSGKRNIGRLAVYRRKANPKALAACVFWGSATRGRVRIDRWQSITEDADPKRDAVRRCIPHERPGCRCQIVDINNRNRLYVPPSVLARLGAPIKAR